MALEKKQKKKMSRVIFAVLLFAIAARAAPASLFGFAEFEPYETPVPVAKLNVEHDAFVDVIIGNPGRTVRLRIDFGQNTSLVLFTAPDDLSREYSIVPPTLLVYMGPALVRLTFRVDASLYDAKSVVKYDGLLGLGRASDVWNYWGLVSVSSHRLVLGDFDKSLSRSTYRPFRLDFTLDNPEVQVTVRGLNFTLSYDPAEYYSTFPRIIYHNITNFELKFNQLHMEIDSNDIRMHLTSGFDRTLVRKTVDVEDTRIVLGEHFSHNFVLYYNVVNQSKHLMPAFDLFGVDHAEPLYSHALFTLFFFLFVAWMAMVTTEKTPTPVKPIIFSVVELYTYAAVSVTTIVDIKGFAYYRNVAFWMSTTSVTSYVVFNSLLAGTVLVGALLAWLSWNTHAWLNIRRVFVEAAFVMVLWLVLSHWTHVMVTFVQVFVVATYCVVRALQTALAFIKGSWRPFFVSSLYLVFGLLFFVFYVLVPTVNFYFYGFAHSFSAGGFIFAFTLALPAVGALAFYPIALIRNSVLATDQSHHLQVRRSEAPPPPGAPRSAPPAPGQPQESRRRPVRGSFAI